MYHSKWNKHVCVCVFDLVHHRRHHRIIVWMGGGGALMEQFKMMLNEIKGLLCNNNNNEHLLRSLVPLHKSERAFAIVAILLPAERCRRDIKCNKISKNVSIKHSLWVVQLLLLLLDGVARDYTHRSQFVWHGNCFSSSARSTAMLQLPSLHMHFHGNIWRNAMPHGPFRFDRSTIGHSSQSRPRKCLYRAQAIRYEFRDELQRVHGLKFIWFVCWLHQVPRNLFYQ